jgi:Protein of unknown function (DUF3093)
MRVYHERLRVPATWWLVALVCVVIFGTGFMAGFSWQLSGAVYALLGVPCAGVLLAWSRSSIDVGGGALRVGAAALPLAAIGQVAALDQAQTRAMRGPHADPAAFLLARPFLPRAVYVEVTDRTLGQPYWLIGTRQPGRLAAAIEAARPAARAGGTPVG